MADSIVRLLGQGTFGKVVEAFDKKRKTKCAVKIIRSVQKYRDASRIELRVLSTLSLNDKTNRNKCIHLRDSFDFRNHICIVTDLLGQSVFDFLKGNGFVPFPSSQIQSFARQLLTSVACKYASTLCQASITHKFLQFSTILTLSIPISNLKTSSSLMASIRHLRTTETYLLPHIQPHAQRVKEEYSLTARYA
jgi:serine/threonine protein kinase